MQTGSLRILSVPTSRPPPRNAFIELTHGKIIKHFPTGLLNAAENIKQARNRGAQTVKSKQGRSLTHNVGHLPPTRPLPSSAPYPKRVSWSPRSYLLTLPSQLQPRQGTESLNSGTSLTWFILSEPIKEGSQKSFLWEKRLGQRFLLGSASVGACPPLPGVWQSTNVSSSLWTTATTLLCSTCATNTVP